MATPALLADQTLEPCLQALQVFAVVARYEESPYPLQADRLELLSKLEALLRSCETAIESLAPFKQSDCSPAMKICARESNWKAHGGTSLF